MTAGIHPLGPAPTRRRRAIRLSTCCLIAALVGCSQSPPGSRVTERLPPPSPWFDETAAQRGLEFLHDSGHRQRFLLPEIMSGGAALFDMDNDGFLDAYLLQSGELTTGSTAGNRLFRNRGDGTFEDVTAGSGADVRGYGMGVAAGDYDADGMTDLYVTQLGHNVLLRNQGGGHFQDVTGRAGVASRGWGTSSVFLDYDGDGRLDLFVANYVDWSPSSERACQSITGVADYCGPVEYNAPRAATLYHNSGDGTFRDVSQLAGIGAVSGNGLGVVSGDFNGDGRVDIYVANDRTPNRLWINQGHGRFEDMALIAGCAVDQDGRPKAGMGVHAGDPDDDGDLDLFVGNMNGETDSFFRNDGTFFSDDSAVVGLRRTSRPFTRFGAALLDFDNDGVLDLFEATGRVGQQAGMFSSDPYAEPNLIFRGLPGGRFEEALPRGGTREPLFATSRAAAFGDIDNDGGIDVLVANRDARPHLLHNVVRARGHWIQFKVVDRHGGDALGATVTVTAAERRVRRDVTAGYSYLASNDPRVHIGLGRASSVTGVTVRWPDGELQSFGDMRADQTVTLQRRAAGGE